MQVDMKDTLPRGFTNVNADIVPIRMKLRIHNTLHFIRKCEHVQLLFFR